MKTSLSLGNFELLLVAKDHIESKEIAPTIAACYPTQEDWILLLPFLFKYFNRGIEIGSGNLDSDYPYSSEKFLDRLNNEIIPKVSQMESFDQVNPIIKEITAAFPNISSAIEQIKSEKESNANNSTPVMAIPILPLIYFLILLKGMSDGLKNKPKK